MRETGGVARRQWYRDLGKEDGHFWAHVQAIKRPTCSSFAGPYSCHNPVSSNLQYRLSEESRRNADQISSSSPRLD